MTNRAPKKQVKRSAVGVAKGYLHGFSNEEQRRLYEQAQVLESHLYPFIDFEGHQNCLELGCGVGAQSEILLKRFPNITLTGVDASHAQIAQAKKHLVSEIAKKRVSIHFADAAQLEFADNSFDSAFLCWFLEHVKNPIEILKELRRVLAAKSKVYCTEVLNATFYVHPYSPATLQYWFTFNDHQWNLGGDPFVGAKLANYFLEAGFQNLTSVVKNFHYDNRAPKQRAQMIDFWTRLLLSGAPELIRAKKVDSKLVNEMKKELLRLKDDPDAVFFYSYVQLEAWAL